MTEYATNIYKKIPSTAEKIVYQASIITAIFSVCYLLSVLMSGNSWLMIINLDISGTGMILSLIQCLLAIAALNVPMLITKFTRIKLPDTLCILFYMFIICATVLGEMFSLYYTIPHWDSFLHLGSGIMAGMLGSILLVEFLKSKKCTVLISPMFVAIVAVCFALCVGVVWEIYEFAGDNLLGLNMQKCLMQDGSELIGKAAVTDTMKDLIVDLIGALIASLASHKSLKDKKGWLHSYRYNQKTAQIYRPIFERQAMPHSP